MRNKIKLSIVIPAYNEEKIIKKNILEVIKYLSKNNYNWELVMVDDGSYDKTAEKVSEIKDKRLSLYGLGKNQGKGAALRRGINESSGEYLIFMDADLSVPLENIDIFIAQLEQKFDVVIGSRRTKGSKIKKHQPWIRENMGRAYTALTRWFTGTDFSDFTCGFKGFTKEAGKDIFKRSLIDRWSYDAEILFLAHKLGYKIKESPVEWHNREDTRVKLGDAVLTSFRDLVKIRMLDFQGKYEI